MYFPLHLPSYVVRFASQKYGVAKELKIFSIGVNDFYPPTIVTEDSKEIH